jgi:hypothetical protein
VTPDQGRDGPAQGAPGVRSLSLPVDRVVRTPGSPNCTDSYGQLAFVRDDRVVRIQQAAATLITLGVRYLVVPEKPAPERVSAGR